MLLLIFTGVSSAYWGPFKYTLALICPAFAFAFAPKSSFCDNRQKKVTMSFIYFTAIYIIAMSMIVQWTNQGLWLLFLSVPNYANIVTQFPSMVRHAFSAIALYKSYPFRRSILTNKRLMLYLATGIIFTIWLTIFCNERFKYAFDLFDFEIYEEESKNNEEIDKKNNKRVDKQYYMINYYLLVISIINAIVNLLFEWVFVEYVNNIWWEKKNKECKELIKIEKKKGIEKPYNINNEVAIREYINIYYHERRNKMKDKIKENGDLYFIDDEDDGIELDDMTPGGQILNK
jgi:hypothetical protein